MARKKELEDAASLAQLESANAIEAERMRVQRVKEEVAARVAKEKKLLQEENARIAANEAERRNQLEVEASLVALETAQKTEEERMRTEQLQKETKQRIEMEKVRVREEMEAKRSEAMRLHSQGIDSSISTHPINTSSQSTLSTILSTSKLSSGILHCWINKSALKRIKNNAWQWK